MVPLGTNTGALPSGPPPRGSVVSWRAERKTRPAGPSVRRVSWMTWRKGSKELRVEKVREEGSVRSRGRDSAD